MLRARGEVKHKPGSQYGQVDKLQNEIGDTDTDTDTLARALRYNKAKEHTASSIGIIAK